MIVSLEPCGFLAGEDGTEQDDRCHRAFRSDSDVKGGVNKATKDPDGPEDARNACLKFC